MKRRSFFGALSTLIAVPSIIGSDSLGALKTAQKPKNKDIDLSHAGVRISSGNIKFLEGNTFLITTDSDYARVGDLIQTDKLFFYLRVSSMLKVEQYEKVFFQYKCMSLNDRKLAGRNVIKLYNGKITQYKNINCDIQFITAGSTYREA